LKAITKIIKVNLFNFFRLNVLPFNYLINFIDVIVNNNFQSSSRMKEDNYNRNDYPNQGKNDGKNKNCIIY